MRRPGSRYTSLTCAKEGSTYLALETGMDNVSRFVWLYASVVLLVVRLVQQKKEFEQTIPLDELSCAVSCELRIAITGDRASFK